eukprot:12053290-Ditylum_brightwellii.AAC.1
MAAQLDVSCQGTSLRYRVTYLGYSVQVDHLKKQSPKLSIPPNSTDGTHLKGRDHGTVTHTVAILPGKEISRKSFLVDSMN